MTTLFSLKNQVAIVTGAASGIGFAIARCLSAAGAQVAMVDRAEEIKTVASKMENPARGYVFDLADVNALGDLIEQIHHDFGRIDVLVNNAGIGMLEPIGEVQLESWNTTMLINMTAPFFLAQHCARYMKAQSFGRLINIASQASVIALNEHAAYCTSKSGMVSFTRVLAAELGPFGITANAISPTVVETELGKRYWHGDRADQMKLKIPSRRFATPDEIASMVLYLSSKEAAMVNGENLVIDGGYSVI